MSAHPGMTRIPDVVWCGKTSPSFWGAASGIYGKGLIAFVSPEDHAASELPEAMIGTNPQPLTRYEVMDLCDVCYVVDPETDEYVSFVISDQEGGK